LAFPLNDKVAIEEGIIEKVFGSTTGIDSLHSELARFEVKANLKYEEDMGIMTF
jgi:hypothetical protein